MKPLHSRLATQHAGRDILTLGSFQQVRRGEGTGGRKSMIYFIAAEKSAKENCTYALHLGGSDSDIDQPSHATATAHTLSTGEF